MAALEVNEAKPKISIGETCVAKVLSDWKGDHVADACIAAIQIGLIHSGGVLSDARARQIIKDGFDSRNIDDVKDERYCSRTGFRTN
jgi:hypothetical protein